MRRVRARKKGPDISLGQLTRLIDGEGALGNRITKTLNGTLSQYQVPDGNRRMATVVNGTTTAAFTYANNGNLQSDGLASSYLCSPSHMLESAMMGAGVVHTFAYDADDQRIVKERRV